MFRVTFVLLFSTLTIKSKHTEKSKADNVLTTLWNRVSHTSATIVLRGRTILLFYNLGESWLDEKSQEDGMELRTECSLPSHWVPFSQWPLNVYHTPGPMSHIEREQLRRPSSLCSHACVWFYQDALTGTANYMLSGPTLDNDFPQIT